MARYIERRGEARTAHKSPVKIKDLKTGRYTNARLVNFSTNGLYFESNKVLRVGTELYLGIENSPFTSVSDVYDIYRVSILWRQRLKSIFYKYGYGVRLISAQDSRHRQVNGFGELRKHARKHYTQSISFSYQNQRHQGVLKNLSPGGVFIETSDPLAVGQIIKLAIPRKNSDKDTIRTGRVVRVSPTGLGVRFQPNLKNK